MARIPIFLVLFLPALLRAEPLGPGVPQFTVRPGYRVTLATAEKLQDSRFLCFDDTGKTLFVSQPHPGTILALRDPDADGVYRSVTPFITGRPFCQGMQFVKGWLWFTTSGGIYKARYKDGDEGEAEEVVPVIPEGTLPHGGHWFRSLLITDDGFYTSIGDTGNITDETKTDREKIWHYDLDGKQKKLFVTGIRNTEKLLFRPGTKEIFGCDHGSDNFGAKFGETAGKLQPVTDRNPPDEFNHYTENGFYGHPFIVGNNIPRPEYANRPDILELALKAIPPAWCFGAHWAPDGWTFLHTDYFPHHKGDAIIAFHGSWNRTEKVGYCIERLLFDEVTQLPYGSLTLVSTITPDHKTVLERPVDATEAPDGTILFSGDLGNRIYRISRAKSE